MLFRSIDSTYLIAGDQHRWVSTVWLGLDHGFGMGGPPLIFETMIFGDHGVSDHGQWRYSTEQAARQGHAEAVFLAKGQLSLATGEKVSEVIDVDEVREALGTGEEE